MPVTDIGTLPHPQTRTAVPRQICNISQSHKKPLEKAEARRERAVYGYLCIKRWLKTTCRLRGITHNGQCHVILSTNGSGSRLLCTGIVGDRTVMHGQGRRVLGERKTESCICPFIVCAISAFLSHRRVARATD